MATYEQAAAKQTQAFILHRPDDITLSRSPEVPDGAGGFTKGPPVTLDPQPGRLVNIERVTNQAPVVTTPDGRQVRPTWALVFMPGADVLPGDECVVRGHALEVVTTSDVPTGRVTAQAVEHG